MILLGALYLTFAGWTLLALATARHHRTAFGQAPGPGRTRVIRTIGYASLVAGCWIWAWDRGVAMGLVGWSLWVLPVAGVAVVVGLTYQPQLTARLALIGLVRPRSVG